MIESGASLDDGSIIRTSVCIIGAGPAGITLALRLASLNLDVLLVEGGGESETDEAADMYRGEVADPALHSPAHYYRHRVFGGSSVTWGGRCVPYDPIDFEQRDWIPQSGWPIAYEDVAQYYPQATRLVEAGDPIYSASKAVVGGMRPTVKGFSPDHFDSDPIERSSLPTRFGRRYRRRLADSDKIRVLLDANCTEVVETDRGGSIDHVVLKTFAGATLTVRADRYVLATGGIEVPRLLLASRRRDPAGIGNGHGLVGRYYMCHIGGTTGALHFSCAPDDVYHGYEQAWDGVYVRRRFQLRAEAQRSLKVPNIVMRLHHPRLPDPAHGRGILSAIYLAKPFISYEYSKRLHGGENMTPTFVLRHIGNVLCEPFGIAAFLASWAWRRTLAARKFPSLIVRPRNNVYSLDVHAEQLPNPDSRVTLSDEMDRFGMPRARIDWRYLPLDIEGVKEAIATFAEDVHNAGVGKLVYNPDTVAHDMLRDGAYGGHHIGTARMAADPSDGVVDPDCRVHGVDNLYISGAAVFPTSGQANPTLTIVAMSLRLADHLAEVYGSVRNRPVNTAGLEPLA